MTFQKPIGILMLSSLIVTIAAGQNQKQDLLHLIAKKRDSAQINAYNGLARLYIPDSLTTADKMASLALEKAKAIKYTKGMLNALKYKGIIADYRGELKVAIGFYDEGIQVCGKGNEWEEERIAFYVNKGVAYYFAGEMGQALKCYLEAEQIMHADENNPVYGKLINNLSVVYRELTRYEEAIRMYKKSLRIKTRIGDSLGMANSYNNIGLGYAYLENAGQSANYLKKAKDLYHKLGEKSEELSVDVSLAVASHKLGKDANAKRLLAQAFAFPELKLSVYELIQAKLLFIELLYLDREYLQARKILQEMEPLILQSNYLKSKVKFSELKAYVLNALGEKQGAYAALLEHKLFTDTLNNETKISLEKDMETKYLTREKENQIEIQQLQISKNKRERLIYLVALLALLLFLGAAYRLSRQRKKANLLLGEKNQQIQQALEDKEILLKEIHHRVKNNLQIISSLLSLQSRRVDDPKVLEAIQDGQNRVQSMALIHENLYQDETLVTVDAQVYIDQLIQNLIHSYNIHPEGISFNKQIDPVKLDIDTIIPLGLILNELISNTLKYAFPQSKKGEVKLQLKQNEAGLLLQVADNGQGLPLDFDPKTVKSMGFRLINSFSKKLNGVLNTWNDSGAHIEIFFPNLKSI